MTSHLKELHWLRIRQRIEYKLAMLGYRCLNGLAPSYFFPAIFIVLQTWSLANASVTSKLVGIGLNQ